MGTRWQQADGAAHAGASCLVGGGVSVCVRARACMTVSWWLRGWGWRDAARVQEAACLLRGAVGTGEGRGGTAGCPCVGSGVGAHAELVRHMLTGTGAAGEGEGRERGRRVQLHAGVVRGALGWGPLRSCMRYTATGTGVAGEGWGGSGRGRGVQLRAGVVRGALGWGLTLGLQAVGVVDSGAMAWGRALRSWVHSCMPGKEWGRGGAGEAGGFVGRVLGWGPTRGYMPWLHAAHGDRHRGGWGGSGRGRGVQLACSVGGGGGRGWGYA